MEAINRANEIFIQSMIMLITLYVEHYFKEITMIPNVNGNQSSKQLVDQT